MHNSRMHFDYLLIKKWTKLKGKYLKRTKLLKKRISTKQNEEGKVLSAGTDDKLARECPKHGRPSVCLAGWGGEWSGPEG